LTVEEKKQELSRYRVRQAEAFLLAVKDYLRKAHKGVGL